MCSGELALLVEGLGTGGDTSIEEYIICPASELTDQQHDKETEIDQIRLYGPEEGLTLVAKHVTGRGSLVSRQGSLANVPLMDPLVTLFGSVHENLAETGSVKHNSFLSNFGSMIAGAENQGKHEHFDVENQGDDDDDDYASDFGGTDNDENLRSPLLSQYEAATEKDMSHIASSTASVLGIRNSSLLQGEALTSTSVGGGWQLAWKQSERVGNDGKKEGGLQRIFLHQEGTVGSRQASLISAPGVPAGGSVYIQAAALVSNQKPVGAEVIQKSPTLRDLLEPGVKRALIVGIGLQVLQQVIHHFSCLSLKFF